MEPVAMNKFTDNSYQKSCDKNKTVQKHSAPADTKAPDFKPSEKNAMDLLTEEIYRRYGKGDSKIDVLV